MIVLIFSLMSTVVVIFSKIMRKLEKWFGISTSEPNKHVGGGSISSASSAGSTADSKWNHDGSIDKSAVGSSSDSASMQYADFDDESSASNRTDRDDRREGSGSDHGNTVGPMPFHGNVVIQANECAVEMQHVQRLPPTISMPSATAHPLSGLQRHAHETGGDRDSQVMAMLVDMRREMRDLSAQVATLVGAQSAQDQKVQQIEQWIRQCGESRESAEHSY